MSIDQEKFQQMAELEQNIKAHQMMHENAVRQLQSLKETLNQLKDFSKLKGDEEILLPLTNGILAEAKLTGKKLLMNVGNGVVVEKTMDECIVALEKQEQEVSEFVAKIEQEYESLSQKVEQFKNV
jgi:prefoldin alpha subunit